MGDELIIRCEKETEGARVCSARKGKLSGTNTSLKTKENGI